MLLDKNIKSYLALLRVWKKNKKALLGCPKFPRYKHKTAGRNVVVFTCNQFKLKGNEIHFPKKSNLFPIKTTKSNELIKQVRIIPKSRHYVIEVIYETTPKPLKQNNNIASIEFI